MRTTNGLHRARRRSITAIPGATSGFTLIESMVAVAILGVLLAAAAPSFRTFIRDQQVKALALDLTADLLLARSEALKRNASVSIAHSGAGWSDGWTTATSVTNERISTRNASTAAIVFSDAPASITFVNGRVSSPAVEVRVTLVGIGTSRCVELDLSGRARSSVGACT
ncbi:MAG: GspH/FimT family pseudopilin [Burkholderiales bacterium]|jgi:type IV fimbrial biogenesis protein FimT|nr:GspH/FimT family pseudopilin [Burkholderiales bacterium]